MHVKHLNLINFRNYDSVDLPLQPGITVLVGRNGQGKTNLVEAIHYSATLSSHRVAGYVPLIKADSSQALIRLLAGFEDRENLIELELNAGSPNRTRVNRADLSRVRDVLGYVNSVIFAPEDLVIVKGDPSDRRHFIDELLVQFSPRLAGTLSDYERVLKQRNTLLKTSRALPKDSPGLATLEAWDESLVELGSEIIVQRFLLIEKLEPFLDIAYKAISEEKNNPTVQLKTSVLAKTFDTELDQPALESANKNLIADLFRAKLAELRTRELERGITLVGPHRDDLFFQLGTLPAKGYISHGESWSFALALKLASASLLRAEARAGDPVLILDDVFAELDSVRRARLVDLISDYEQVIITAAVFEDIPTGIVAKRFTVANGKVEPTDE
ncbi:MAG: DNA replication/repair protein RecF [Micrococcales bacterium]|nr:DNA replication/repair protein RecF [Micrococcales bacterium]